MIPLPILNSGQVCNHSLYSREVIPIQFYNKGADFSQKLVHYQHPIYMCASKTGKPDQSVYTCCKEVLIQAGDI